MPRNAVPTYRRHKQSGQAIVTLPDPLGRRRDVLLGKFGTPESRAEYARVIAEWEAAHRHLPREGSQGTDLTVNEMLLRFWGHVETHYRHADGSPTTEVENYRYSLRPLKELYGHTRTAEFGPLALKAVRKRMIDAGLARTLINQRVGRIKRAFKWAVGEELVPPAVYQGLQAVAGLERGRSQASEREPVKPVPDGLVHATLPLLTRHVRGMVQLQRLTGMRPSEVCNIRRSDIDMNGRVWVYAPKQHKTAWRGKQRQVHIGPKAQALLKEYFTLREDDYLFSPRRAMQEFRATQRAGRVSKVQPSQQSRRAAKPKKQPGERYTHRTYDQAIAKACGKAGVSHWHANQLRHTFATEVRKAYGVEGSQVMLDHAKADVTQVYAERDMSFAVRIAAEVG